VPVTERPILLTGATGFVGMAVLSRLLAAGHEVHCLVRAGDDAKADSRLRSVLARVQAPSTGRAVAIAGDLTARRLGLGDRHDQVAARVGTVIHSAASVAFDLPLEEARAINVEGTRRVLDFAGAVPGLQRVTYVSTAYVAGDRRGTAYEDDRETGAFRNSYERSKHEAEALVRSSTLPWTIARPSIVVGESTTGWTASFNVLYGPLRAFDAGAYPVLPARRRSPVDVVPVDYVADAVAALAQHPEAAGGTFHLTAGAGASSVGEIMTLATSRFDRPAPRVVPPRAYRRLLHPLVLRRVSPSTRRLLVRSEVYFPYFAMRVRFDDARARALLAPMGIAPAPLPSYFGRLIEFARAARWGRRPLDRAAAVELAGVSSDVRAPALRPPLGAAAMPA
jgi:long-chain acyl-CoA synthetase